MVGICRRRSDNDNRGVARVGVVARLAAFVHDFLADCMVELDNELKGGNCSSTLEEVALGAVRGALSLLPHTARRGPARRSKREETVLETRDIFVLKVDSDKLEACLHWCS